jgi:hypothetical protein
MQDEIFSKEVLQKLNDKSMREKEWKIYVTDNKQKHLNNEELKNYVMYLKTNNITDALIQFCNHSIDINITTGCSIGWKNMHLIWKLYMCIKLKKIPLVLLHKISGSLFLLLAAIAAYRSAKAFI